MAAKKSTAKKSTAKKAVKIFLHKPGVVPETVKVSAGTTYDDFIQEYNLGGYDVFVNGQAAINTALLKEGDTVRVGIKTKNA